MLPVSAWCSPTGRSSSSRSREVLRRAGIQAGDVIISVNGRNIDKASDFATMIAAMVPESIVNLSTYRDGQPMEIKLMLGSGKCPRAQHGGVPVLARESRAHLHMPLRNV
jgi:PDZ domain-containing secreted protein